MFNANPTKCIALALPLLLAGCSHDLDNVAPPGGDRGADLAADRGTGDLPTPDRGQDAARTDVKVADLKVADLKGKDSKAPDQGKKKDGPAPDQGKKKDGPVPDKAPAPDLPPPDQKVTPDLQQCAACSDGKSCTQDLCTDAGCVNKLLPGFCDIGGTCIAKGTKAGGSTCLECAPAYNPRVWGPAPGCVITVAGTGKNGHADGPTSSAQLKGPWGVAEDGAGVVYIAERTNNLVRKVEKGMVSTVAGTPNTTKLNQPFYVAVGAGGEVYISAVGEDKIKVLSNGQLSTFAGTGSSTFYTNGAASSATFFDPMGLAVGPGNSLYVVDSKFHVIRQIKNNTVSTFAGTPKLQGWADGQAGGARFKYPAAIDHDGKGKFYVADTQNNRIRMIYAGIVTTVVGTGFAGGTDGATAKASTMNWPGGIAVDRSNGDVYFADSKNHTIRVLRQGKTYTLNKKGQGFQDGKISAAKFYNPQGIFITKAGYIFIADFSNHRVRAFKP